MASGTAKQHTHLENKTKHSSAVFKVKRVILLLRNSTPKYLPEIMKDTSIHIYAIHSNIIYDGAGLEVTQMSVNTWTAEEMVA